MKDRKKIDINESTGSYDAEKEYGISEEYYKDFIMACTYEAEGELWTEYTMKTKKLKSGV